jgi:hypothetical protein
VDEEVVVDGNLMSSRSPSDLPAPCSTILKQFAPRRVRNTNVQQASRFGFNAMVCGHQSHNAVIAAVTR